MSDNVAVTPGSGATVAADNVGGVLYQRVKAVWGADGAVNDTSAADPMPVTVASGALTLTGEDHIGEVGGNTTVIKVTPTISTGIYAALDVIGGIITLTNAMRVSGGSGVLQSLTIVDEDNEKAAMEVMIFDASPASGTYTDNGALVHSAGDVDKLLARFQVAAADYVTVVATSLAVATIKGLGIPVKASGSANLYALILVTGTPTYTAATDLRLHFGFLRD